MKRILASIICAALLAVPAVSQAQKSGQDSCCAQEQAQAAPAAESCCDEPQAKAQTQSCETKASCCDSKPAKVAKECTSCPPVASWFMGKSKSDCKGCKTASL